MSEVSDFKSGPFGFFNQPPTATTYSGTASIPGPGFTAAQGDYSFDGLLGLKFSTTDGRTLALVRNAATAITSGKLMQAPAEVTAHEKLAMTVPTATPATVGTTAILVTNGATVINENNFRGGYAIVASGTGIGQTFQIASHPGAAASATCLVQLADPIQVTLDATSKISLVKNPYKDVVITDHTTLSAPIGASAYPIPASVANTFDGTSGVLTTAGTPVYAYIVTHGPTAVLVDSTVTNVGYPLGRSQATDGAVGVQTLTTTVYVGTSMQTLTSAQAGPVYLNL